MVKQRKNKVYDLSISLLKRLWNTHWRTVFSIWKQSILTIYCDSYGIRSITSFSKSFSLLSWKQMDEKHNKDWHKKRKNICKYLYICWWFNSVQWCWWIWPSLNSVIFILQNQNLGIRMISAQKVHFYIWVLELKMIGFHKSLWQTKWFSVFPMLECLIYAALDIHSV